MLLPEAIERENNKMFEEVKIPHSEPMPIGIEEKPVYIKDLDEVRKSIYVCLLKKKDSVFYYLIIISIVQWIFMVIYRITWAWQYNL